MRKFNLLAMLNLKIMLIVSFLLLSVTGYYYWMTIADVVQSNERHLIRIVDFLQDRIDPAVLTSIEATATSEGIVGNSKKTLYNKELQPLLDAICMPLVNIKYGFYIKSCKSIVAIGPEFDGALVFSAEENCLGKIFCGDTARFIEQDRACIWYGDRATYYVSPIIANGEIAGYSFAAVNREIITKLVLKRIANILGVVLAALLICILIFWGLFRKLELELYEFAKRLVVEEAADYQSKIPEFSPIFNYIGAQTKRLQQLDRLDLVSKMAAGLAHEIRNPLTTVRGFLQYMSRKREFMAHSDKFALMIEELDCANRITTEFLSLSKEKTMNFKSENLNQIIQNVYPLLQSDAVYKDCTIKLALQSIPNIILDKSSINQLILNLFKNAIDAMPNGGKVTIATQELAAGISLMIQDEGEGISPENKDKIGTPFFTTKETGTGLGVSICLQIIQRHGAKVHVDSEIGRGTTFTIYFPYATTIVSK